MSEQDDELRLEDVLARWREAIQEELHTATVGQVERVHRVTDASGTEIVVDVKPLVRRSVRATDDTFVREDMPILRSVRLVTPRTGSWFVHLPIDVGDYVLIVALERDPARAFVTGEVSDPIDRRHHHLAHAVAIPGLFPRTRRLPDELAPSDAMVLGHVDGAQIRVKDDSTIELAGTSPLALANVTAHLGAISQDLTAIAAAAGTTATNYGEAAKTVLDGTHPVEAQRVKGA